MTRTQRMKASGLLLLGLLICAVNASAHHGVAAFDVSKTVTVTGTVTGFRFDNPHVLLYFNVKDADGKVEMWVGELNSRNALERLGWTSHIVKPGDGITVIGHPSRIGTKSAWVTKVVLPGGRALDAIDQD